jgi:GNAT superfamily N-acetyltransferase
MNQQLPALTIAPVTADRWDDLERLFGPRGACGGCWCMHWRLTSAEYAVMKGNANRELLRELVASGAEPGLLAYIDGEPAGWVAIAPREEYPRLDHSRILKPVDDQPVWSIVCLFISPPYRRRGLSTRLIEAAARHAAARGATTVEAYPVEPRSADMPGVFAFTGTAAAFRAAGFVEVARRSETRPIMRRSVGEV